MFVIFLISDLENDQMPNKIITFHKLVTSIPQTGLMYFQEPCSTGQCYASVPAISQHRGGFKNISPLNFQFVTSIIESLVCPHIIELSPFETWNLLYNYFLSWPT